MMGRGGPFPAITSALSLALIGVSVNLGRRSEAARRDQSTLQAEGADTSLTREGDRAGLSTLLATAFSKRYSDDALQFAG
jgi:hypothetical protein